MHEKSKNTDELKRIGIRQPEIVADSDDKALRLLRSFGFLLNGGNGILSDGDIVNLCNQQWNTEVFPYLKERGIIVTKNK